MNYYDLSILYVLQKNEKKILITSIYFILFYNFDFPAARLTHAVWANVSR
jgi:hypothetical protein